MDIACMQTLISMLDVSQHAPKPDLCTCVGHNNTDMGHQTARQEPGCLEWQDGRRQVFTLQL